MNLRQALQAIETADDGATIFAAEPWRPDSRTVLAVEGEAEAELALAEGLTYLLEVSLAKEVLRVWSAWRSGQPPGPEDRCTAVIHYAINDAYLPPQDQSLPN